MEENNKLRSDCVGKKIKIRLIELGMSQTELAKAVGTSRIYINHIISGYRTGGKYIKAIEEVLKISLESFEEIA